jgi:hypothetical protein
MGLADRELDLGSPAPYARSDRMDDQGSLDGDAGLRRMADGFLTAFNRRDAEGLLEFVDADIEFRPTVLATLVSLGVIPGAVY